ncbi:hypothetical protein HDE_13358 [Halotydeus destructor]|nr:hypothetical protein HDE_13358 [Halotydeus destructor]
MAGISFLIALCLSGFGATSGHTLRDSNETFIPIPAEYPRITDFPIKECTKNSDCSKIEGSLCHEVTKYCACAAKLIQYGDKCLSSKWKDRNSSSKPKKTEIEKSTLDSLREILIDYILYAIAGLLFFGGVGAAPIKGESLFSRAFRRRESSTSRQTSQTV